MHDFFPKLTAIHITGLYVQLVLIPTNITAVQGRASSLRGSGIAHLIVHNKVDASTNSEVREI